MSRTQTSAELVADGTIHVLGILLGIAATVTLIVVVSESPEIWRQVCILTYCATLMAMLIFSALYNMLARDERHGILRRLDQAAIFLLIAGTYTPLAAMVIGGWTGGILLVVVWTGALTGAVFKLLHRTGLERWTVPICLVLGWLGFVAAGPLFQKASITAFLMILAGGVLYTVGTAFYSWKQLPFQNAIWHAFVLAAAICHYVAVLTDVALV